MCDEHWVTNGIPKSLYDTPETDITLYVKYTEVKIKTIKNWHICNLYIITQYHWILSVTSSLTQLLYLPTPLVPDYKKKWNI